MPKQNFNCSFKAKIIQILKIKYKKAMELGTFGVENNYLEAILRSLRLSLLKEDNYAQIKNLQSLNDLKQVNF